jgi:hypothetical protein
MPWSTLVETMGLEPTTPSLQTVRLVVVARRHLGSDRRVAARYGLVGTVAMAHVWPTEW